MPGHLFMLINSYTNAIQYCKVMFTTKACSWGTSVRTGFLPLLDDVMEISHYSLLRPVCIARSDPTDITTAHRLGHSQCSWLLHHLNVSKEPNLPSTF